jgi:hypothetical protein
MWGVGSIAFFAVWFGILIYGIAGQLVDINSTLELRRHSVHTTGIALSTRSEEWHDDETAYIVYYTKVGFVVGTDRRVGEIAGKHTTGEKVAIVYDPDNPDVVGSESSIEGGSLVGYFVHIAFMLGMIVFGIGFVISWYSFDS